MRITTWQAWCWIVVSVFVLTGCRPIPPESRWMNSGLTAGDRTFQELEAGATHIIPLHLSEASYLSVTLEQVGVDLELTLRGPRGEELARVDGPAGANRGEFMAAETQAGGAHRLEVRSPSGQGGAYVLELSALRGLQEGDEVRVKGWRELQIAHHAPQTRVARKHLETALEYFRRSPEPIGEAYTLQQLGWMADDLQGPTGALEQYDAALARLSGVSAPGTRAGLLADRASALASLGRLTEARTQYERAIDLWRQVGDEKNLTETLNSLSKVLNEQGEVREARRLLTEVLERRQAQGDLVGEATTWSLLGTIYSKEGSLSQALGAHREALTVARQIHARGLELRSLINMGAVLRSLAEPQAALRFFDRALELVPEVQDVSERRRLMSHLGLVHAEIGDPDGANPYFEKALGLAVTPPDRADVLRNWGWVETDRGCPECALERYGQALEVLPKDVLYTDRSWLHIGRARALRHLGRLADARTAIEQAADGAEMLAAQDRTMLLLERGEIARLQGRREDGRRDLRRALERSRQRSQASQEALALVRLGQLARDAERFAEALELLEEALGLYESLRAQVTSSLLRTSYLAQRLHGFEAYLDLLVELALRQPDAHLLEQAFWASERMRARTLHEILSESSASVPGLTPELLQRKRRAVENLQRVQQRLQVEDGKDWRAELERWQHELERIQWQIDDSPRSIGPGPAERVTPERVRDLLPPGTVLLEYAPGLDRSFVFVVTDEALHLRVLPPFPAIEARVRDLVEALSSPSRLYHARRQRLSRDLYRVLIEPVEELLREAEHLVVVPLGALHHLPFETLWDGREYVVNRWAVSYVPSVAVLERLTRMPAGKRTGLTFLAFADPGPMGGRQAAQPAVPSGSRKLTRGNFVTALRRGDLRRLPGAREEVEAIARLLAADETLLYVGSEATEDRLKSMSGARHARWLHIASHGFLENRAGFSGLLLARDEESAEDGLLQVHEIRDLRLTADLVVLSACETGLGTVVRGEGLVGLARAFLAAGARNLVVSLWRVEDRSTADLMVAFYRRLHQGESPARALQGAKLQLLAEDSGWAEPYHWAPFVLIGGPR